MSNLTGKWINRIGLRKLLMTVFSVGVVLLALISTLVTSELSSRSLAERLGQEGLKLTGIFGERSRVALLYQSETDAKYISDEMLAFPDVLAVGLYDDKHVPVYTSSQELETQKGAWHWPDQIALDHEGGDAWHFVTPVYTGAQSDSDSPFVAQVKPELVGYARVIFGKETLHRMESDIYTYNLAIALAVAMVLLILLFFITRWVTRPVNNLAVIMRQAREGEHQVRAPVEGTREMIEMELAFNAMMDELNARAQELRNARDLALEAARVKGEFAANVSHELRTPLNGVLGMLELLGDMGLTSKQSEYVDIASGSAEALLTLIDDILDFSKIDSGKMALDNQQFDLCAVLEDVVVLLSTQAQRKDIDLAYLTETGLPENLLGDAGRIRQVLINLVGNALKFTEQGEVGIHVKLEPEQSAGQMLRFEVTDTGIGMGEDAQQRIFEAFSQADGSTTRKYGGTGLGLAISRQLVNLMGGEIGVESDPGKGSTFWFTVNIALAGAEASPLLITAPAGYRTLIVDDSPLNRRYLGQHFESLGLHYDLAADGNIGLDKLRLAAAEDKAYDLVLIDEVMPGMKGSDLAHRIVSEPQVAKTKVVMMVNRVNPTYENTQSLNIDGFLAKPLIRKELVSCLTGLVEISPRVQDNNEADIKPATTATTFNGSRILIVEDNRANQQVAMGMLERLGCKVALASNGAEAVELVARDAFDLVLMDCHMPEMDGYEATVQIRRLEADKSAVPIVAMTANVQKGESEKCLATGMNDYLSKPLKLERLRAVLGEWLTADELLVCGANGNIGANGDLSELDRTEPTEPVIDSEVLATLREQIGDAFATMVEVFLDDIPSYTRSLRDAGSVEDTQAIADIAHSIKGAAGNFGAARLTEVCQLVEDKGRAADLNNIAEAIDNLVSEAGLVEQALATFSRQEMAYHEAEQESFSDEDMAASDADEQRILIVDDDRGMRFAMRKVLENDGYRVDEVKDGEQALMYCERFMPDLVLMDAIMPEMDGFEACSQIQTLPGGKHMPVLIITALNDEISIGRAFSAGATDYISKPVNFAVLRKRIARLLQASRAEKYVHKLAYNDTLTGLPNRALFNEQLNDVISAIPDDGMAAILFLDLDRFKLVNDTFGHDAGDLLLKVVAERLLRSVRQGDIVSRFGGDEFVIVLDRVKSYAAVKNVATKIHENLSRPFVFLGKEMHVSTSIGISMYPENADDIGTLLKHADIAMYRAKEQGNCYEFYESNMEVEVARRLGIENDLRGAIGRDEMVVYYQPQQDLRTGKLIGMEALVRWNHPRRGLVSPLEFIGLAEETGQIFELGEWVMKTACEQLKTWLDSGCEPLRVAVNLAGRQLDNGDIVERVAATLMETCLPPQHLELEITESTIMENAEDVILTLDRLKKMGVQLAVDDFGTGYSSLSYLKRFPIDLLKIDRAFVSDIINDKADADIVTTIITLAHSLGVKVIAEGVETEHQKQFLKQEDCDYMQGFLLGKPVPAEEFEAKFLAKPSKVVSITQSKKA